MEQKREQEDRGEREPPRHPGGQALIHPQGLADRGEDEEEEGGEDGEAEAEREVGLAEDRQENQPEDGETAPAEDDAAEFSFVVFR